MSEALWAYFEDALKLILTGSLSKSLAPGQRGIFVKMLGCGFRGADHKRTEERHIPGVRTQQYCVDRVTEEHRTMYCIPDLFKYMVTAFDDFTAPLPVDLAYLKTMSKDAEGDDGLTTLIRKIEIEQEIAELERTSHGGDPVKLEAKYRLQTQLNAELAEVSEQISPATRTGDMVLQEAANALAMEWKQNNRRTFTKRKIAEELAKSDEFCDMTAVTIERILRVKW